MINKSKSLLVITHEFPPSGGGAGRNLALVCNELHRQGYPLEVWTGAPNGPPLHFPFLIKNFWVGRKNRFETNMVRMGLFLIQALAFAVKKPKPLGIVSNMALPAGAVGAFLASYWRVPHVIWHHGSDVHGGHAKGAGLLQRFLLRMIWRRAKHGYFVSDSLLQMAKTFGRLPRSSVLPSFADPEYIKAAVDSDLEPKKSSGFISMERYFLFVGRFEPVKNPLLLLEALIVILKSKGKLRPIKMVGQGSLQSEIREKIRNSGLEKMVCVEDPVSHLEMSGLLGGAYALIVPSCAEGLCTTILEAAAFGVPALGSNTVGVKDAILDEQTGLLFRENSAHDLAQALIRISDDVELRNKLGKAAAINQRSLTPVQAADLFLAPLTLLGYCRIQEKSEDV